MKKGKPFDVFCKITYDFCLYLHGLLNAFSVLQKVEFHNGETLIFAKWKTRSANIVNIIEKSWADYFFAEFWFIFIGFPCSFWLGILNFEKVSFSVTKLNVTEVGNLVQQTMVLASPNGRQK